jgi:hypothetical protein
LVTAMRIVVQLPGTGLINLITEKPTSASPVSYLSINIASLTNNMS